MNRIGHRGIPVMLTIVLAMLTVIDAQAEDKAKPSTDGAAKSRIFVQWADAITSVTWGERQAVAPNPRRPVPGGAMSMQMSTEPIRILGRLVSDRRDMGRLANPRYLELVRFYPANAGKTRSRTTLTMDNVQKAKLLKALRGNGDTAAIITGRLRKTSGRSHDGINTWTRTEFVVEQSQTLDIVKAGEVGAELLKADELKQFISQITPIELGSLRMFIEKPVVHPELKGRYRSKVLVRFRVYNNGNRDIELAAPTVRMKLDGNWVDCTPVNAATAKVPAGSYTPASFRIYKPQTAASPGEEVSIETTYTLGDKQKQATHIVRALE